MTTYEIEITRISDGKAVKYADEYPYGENDLIFQFEEHNYSCDCNRAILFNRAIGQKRGLENYECSEGKYRVRLFRPDGSLIFSDVDQKHPRDL